jgi:hypothetical protein
MRVWRRAGWRWAVVLGAASVAVAGVVPADAQEAPPPMSTTVTPDADLVDGQVVEVRLEGAPAPVDIEETGTEIEPGLWTPNLAETDPVYYVRQCREPWGGPCTQLQLLGWDVAEQVWRLPVAVQRVLGTVASARDCARLEQPCALTIHRNWYSNPVYNLPVATARIRFVDPELDVTVSPWATSRAGSDLAVARAEVSCDVSTPVSASAVVSQAGGPTTTVRVDGQRCRPGEPLPLFLATRDVPPGSSYDLGPGEVALDVSATTAFDPLPATSTAATVQFLDEQALAEAVRVALEGPDGVEVLAELQRAIRARVVQDPPFLDEYRAALR